MRVRGAVGSLRRFEDVEKEVVRGGEKERP